VVTKCTMLFQLLTGRVLGTSLSRIGGWSESWYISNSGPASIALAFRDLCRLRAAMLPTDSNIIGQRYQQVDPTVRSSQVSAFNYPGMAATAPDVPQMSVLVKIGATGGNPNIRQWAIRGLPDARVVNGEYVPSGQFTAAFEAFRVALGGWQFRGVNLLANQAGINFIDASGDVWLTSPLTLTPNQMVKVIKTTNANDRQVGGLYQVATVANSSNFTLREWDQGLCSGGTVRINEIIYPQCDPANITLGRVSVRKVGRPFFSYRGRRSNRR